MMEGRNLYTGKYFSTGYTSLEMTGTYIHTKAPQALYFMI